MCGGGGGWGCVCVDCVGCEVCDNHKKNFKESLVGFKSSVIGGKLPFMRSFHKPIHFSTRKIVMILCLPVCN